MRKFEKFSCFLSTALTVFAPPVGIAGTSILSILGETILEEKAKHSWRTEITKPMMLGTLLGVIITFTSTQSFNGILGKMMEADQETSTSTLAK